MDTNKIRVRLDLDQVLNELAEHWLTLHYEHTGEKLNATEWGLDKISKYGNSIYDYFYEPNFFYDIPIKPGSVRLINFLDQNSQFIEYIIVSSIDFTEDNLVKKYVEDQKRAWLLANFGDHVSDKLITTGSSKKGYPADIIVDDNIKHILDSPKNSLKILFQAEHNKKVDPSQFDEKTLIGIRTLKEVEDIIREVLFEGSVSNYFKVSNKRKY